MPDARVDLRPRPARSETDLLVDQLRAIAAWTRDNRTGELLLVDAQSREALLDLSRRHDVVERQRLALIDWTDRQLRDSDRVLRSVAPLRAMVVHRHEWFKGKVIAGLEAAGIAVVADLENGADAVGVVVAEQPDLLLLENKLHMLFGLEVTRAVRTYSPATLVVAQVENDSEIGPFLEAGAATAYTRRIPPADIVAALCEYLAA